MLLKDLQSYLSYLQQHLQFGICFHTRSLSWKILLMPLLHYWLVAKLVLLAVKQGLVETAS